MDVLQHVILTPGQAPEVRKVALTYDDIVNVVGYPVEVVNLNGGQATMYICEEGKQRNFPANDRATRLAGPNLMAGDYIVGTALIVGPLGPGGVDTSLPDATLASLLATLGEEPQP